MRALDGKTIFEAVQYLKTVDRRVLHIEKMLETANKMSFKEVIIFCLFLFLI
jgi:hypothetical protein